MPPTSLMLEIREPSLRTTHSQSLPLERLTSALTTRVEPAFQLAKFEIASALSYTATYLGVVYRPALGVGLGVTGAGADYLLNVPIPAYSEPGHLAPNLAQCEFPLTVIVQKFTNKGGDPVKYEPDKGDIPGAFIKEAKVVVKSKGAQVGNPVTTDDKGEAKVAVKGECNTTDQKGLEINLEVTKPNEIDINAAITLRAARTLRAWGLDDRTVLTPTKTATPTITIPQTATVTPTSTPTRAVTATFTATPQPTRTSTPLPSATATEASTSTPTPTITPSPEADPGSDSGEIIADPVVEEPILDPQVPVDEGFDPIPLILPSILGLGFLLALRRSRINLRNIPNMGFTMPNINLAAVRTRASGWGNTLNTNWNWARNRMGWGINTGPTNVNTGPATAASGAAGNVNTGPAFAANTAPKSPEWIDAQNDFENRWNNLLRYGGLPQITPGAMMDPDEALLYFENAMNLVHDTALTSTLSPGDLAFRIRAGVEYLLPQVWTDQEVRDDLFNAYFTDQDRVMRAIYIPLSIATRLDDHPVFNQTEIDDIKNIHRVMMRAVHTNTGIVWSDSDPALADTLKFFLDRSNQSWQTYVSPLL